MRKILMLLQGEFPPDIRLEKEITTLSNNGYKITLICNRFSSANPSEFNGCKIIRPFIISKNKRINKLFNFPIIFNPIFLFFVLWNSIKVKPDFIHAHDLPTMPFGTMLKKILKAPLIFDMHENYPAALNSYNKKGVFNKIFKNPKIASNYEHKAIFKANKIISVVEENIERLVNMGKNRDDISLISNTVDLETFAQLPPQADIVNKYKNNYIILYTGGVTFNRGLETPLRAMEKIRKRIPNSLLLIIGEGDDRGRLKEIANNMKLNDVVKFIDWPGHEKLSSYLNVADICTIPQPNIESNNTTIPHKLFEYMSQGKTLLVSDALPLKRIVTQAKCGVYFESFNIESFVEKVIYIYNSNENFSVCGKKAVIEEYNWNKREAKVLMNLYRKLSNYEL